MSREAYQILCSTEASWIYKFGTIINLGSDHATKVGRLNETRCQCWSWLRSMCRVDRVELQEVSLQNSTKLLGSAAHLYSIRHDFPVLWNKDEKLLGLKQMPPPTRTIPTGKHGGGNIIRAKGKQIGAKYCWLKPGSEHSGPQTGLKVYPPTTSSWGQTVTDPTSFPFLVNFLLLDLLFLPISIYLTV